jgi:hypothetical protein
MADFRAALDSGRHRAQVLAQSEAFREAGFRSSPVFVINGRRASNDSAIIPLVEEALRKAGQAPPPVPGQVIVNRGQGGQPTPLAARFRTEPRDDAWASALERYLGPRIEADLRAIETSVTDVTVACRREVCRVRWRQAQGDPVLLHWYVRLIFARDNHVMITHQHMMFISVTDGANTETAESAIARLRSRRLSLLHAWRTGRDILVPGLTAQRLPRD